MSASASAPTSVPLSASDTRYKERAGRGVFKQLSVDWSKTTWSEYCSGTFGVNAALSLFGRSCYQAFSEDYRKHCVEYIVGQCLPELMKGLASYDQAKKYLSSKVEDQPGFGNAIQIIEGTDHAAKSKLLKTCRDALKGVYTASQISTAGDFRLKGEYQIHLEGIIIAEFQKLFDLFEDEMRPVLEGIIKEALQEVPSFKGVVDDMLDFPDDKKAQVLGQAKKKFHQLCIRSSEDSADTTSLGDKIALHLALAVSYEKGIGTESSFLSKMVHHERVTFLMIQNQLNKLELDRAVSSNLENYDRDIIEIVEVLDALAGENRQSKVKFSGLPASQTALCQLLDTLVARLIEELEVELDEDTNFGSNVEKYESSVRALGKRIGLLDEPFKQYELVRPELSAWTVPYFNLMNLFKLKLLRSTEAGYESLGQPEKVKAAIYIARSYENPNFLDRIDVEGVKDFEFNPDPGKAVNWYLEAYDLDQTNKEALQKLIHIYTEGIGCDVDSDSAQKLQRELDALEAAADGKAEE